MGMLQGGNIELLHLEKGLRYAGDFFGVLIGKQRVQPDRRDLPRDTILVLQPATLFGLRIGGKFAPKIVDLLLRCLRGP